jgi:hypothetical protein
MSVIEMFRPLAVARQQLVSVEAGWIGFLDYLESRNGSDLIGLRDQKEAEIQAAVEYLEENPNVFEENTPLPGWFATFNSREDVIRACKQFLKNRGLTTSWPYVLWEFLVRRDAALRPKEVREKPVLRIHPAALYEFGAIELSGWYQLGFEPRADEVALLQSRGEGSRELLGRILAVQNIVVDSAVAFVEVVTS